MKVKDARPGQLLARDHDTELAFIIVRLADNGAAVLKDRWRSDRLGKVVSADNFVESQYAVIEL